jgi:hypothetical protein
MDKQLVHLIVGLVLFAILLIVAASRGEVSELFFRNPEKWYGEMICKRCGYRWTSRKNTTPAKCPHCRSSYISIVTGANQNGLAEEAKADLPIPIIKTPEEAKGTLPVPEIKNIEPDETDNWIYSASRTAKIIIKPRSFFNGDWQDPLVFLRPPGIHTVRITGLPRPQEVAVNDEGFAVIADWGDYGKLNTCLVFVSPEGTIAKQEEFEVGLGHLAIEPDGEMVFITTACSTTKPGRLLCYEMRTGILKWEKDSPKPAAPIVVAPEEKCILVGKPHVDCGSSYLQKINYDGELIEQYPDSPYEVFAIAEQNLAIGKTTEAKQGFLLIVKTEISKNYRARAYRHLGELSEDLGLPQEALGYYQEAIKIDPKIGLIRRIEKLRASNITKEIS